MTKKDDEINIRVRRRNTGTSISFIRTTHCVLVEQQTHDDKIYFGPFPTKLRAAKWIKKYKINGEIFRLFPPVGNKEEKTNGE